MGTRSMTYVMDGHGDQAEVIVGMYRQMDGYPTGHGQDLKNFLTGMVVGNGIGCNMPDKYANGMGCLAAQMVAEFKDGPGGIYLMAGKDHGQDYDYFIGRVLSRIYLKIVHFHFGQTIYNGPVESADMEAIEAHEGDEPWVPREQTRAISVEGDLD